MTKEARTQVTTRHVLNPISRPQITQVVARTNDQHVDPAPDREMMGLVEGLKVLNPELQRYSHISAMVNSDRDTRAGATARQKGEELSKDSPEWFKHGYMAMDGQVKGDLDGKAIAEAYATEFDKDTGNLDGFIREKFQGLTKGIKDESFMGGYNQTILKHLQGVRQGHLEYQQNAVVQKVESNAMVKLDNYLRPFVERGEAIPGDGVDQIRGELKEFFKVSGTRFNDLLFTSVKRLGDEGNYSVYEMFKKPRPDGTPGMYWIPAWKEKIDQAQVHAQNVFLTRSKEADAANRKAREDRQDTTLYEVFLKMDTDPAAARTEYAKLRSEGLFSRASDVINWDTKFNAASKREASAEQQDLEISLQQRIYTSQVRPQDIVQADITPAQKRSLMSEWYRAKNDNRQAAAAEQTAADSIYRTQDFRSGETYIETVLRPQATPLDVMGIGTEFARQQMAAARKEFTIRAREVKNPFELHELASGIATRFLDRRKDPRVNQELDMAGSLRYSTLEELKAASDAGLLTDTVEFENHLRYFKALQEKKSPGKAQ